MTNWQRRERLEDAVMGTCYGCLVVMFATTLLHMGFGIDLPLVFLAAGWIGGFALVVGLCLT